MDYSKNRQQNASGYNYTREKTIILFLTHLSYFSVSDCRFCNYLYVDVDQGIRSLAYVVHDWLGKQRGLVGY